MAVGPGRLSDGPHSPPTGRQAKTLESVVTSAHGRYHEAASRGVVFGACEQAGVAPGTALGTTACLALYNPRGTGKILSILKVSLGYISGTLGAGTVFHCANIITDSAAFSAIAAPSSGTALNIYNRGMGIVLTNELDDPVATCRSAATVTPPVAIRPFCSFGASLASTAIAPWQITEDIGGGIVVFPGFCYQLQGITAAGSSPLVAPAVEWEEIPYIP